MKHFSLFQTFNFTDFYHDKDHNNLDIPKRPTAVVEAESLEEVYSLSQHLEDSWFGTQKAGIMVCIRSTSVGDVIYDREEKKAYVVDTVGFVEYEGGFDFKRYG